MAIRFVSAAVVLAAAGMAQADVSGPGKLASTNRYDMGSGKVTNLFLPPHTAGTVNRGPGPAVLYSNLTGSSAPTTGFSLTGTTSTFGDRVTTVGTGGALEEFACTVFSGTGTGSGTLTATAASTLNISFFRGANNSLLGSFSIPLLPFIPTGLAAGFYTIIDIVGISLAANISFDTTDVLIEQSLSNVTGGRSGIVIFNPVAIGSSAQSMFINGPGAPSNFYNIGTPPVQANPGYFVFIPTPGAAAVLGLGGLIATRRRR